MTYSLWPHQAKTEPLLTSGSAILWHEMRLGKTRSALHAYNQMIKAGQVQDLIVVTVSMAKTTWSQEVQEMKLGIPVYTCFGQKHLEMKPGFPDEIDPQGHVPRIYVINWEILPQWQRWLQQQTYKRDRKYVLVLDEGHLNLRNPNNKRYKAAHWLMQFAKATWELTGTLMVKSGLDIFYQARFLGRKNDPFAWMDSRDFGERYCNRRFNPFMGKSGGWEYTSLKDTDGLVAHLPRMSVLRIEDVAEIETIQMPRWVEDMGREWNFHRDDRTLAEELDGLINIKARLTAEYVTQLEQRPVVVFGWNTRFTEQVAELLEAPLIYGGTSAGDKERIRAAFQAGHIPVLVGNLRSLGLGISLSRANHFVYGQPYWDAALYLQAMARGTSLDKNVATTHHHLLVAGSVDEYVWKVRLDRGHAIERLYQAAGEADLVLD